MLFGSALVGASYLAPEATSKALKDTYSGDLLQLVSTEAPVLMDKPAAERFQQFLDSAPTRDTTPPEEQSGGSKVR